MYTSLAVANPQSLRLIQECLSLENKLDCYGVTDLVLKANNNPQGRLQGIKKLILNTDWKSVSVKQVDTRAHPLLPKSPLTPPGPNCWTWLWIMAHKAQLHYRLSTALSPDPALVKSHALFAITSLPNYLILNTSSCHTPIVIPEFIVELLARESTDIFGHTKHFLHPVSL